MPGVILAFLLIVAAVAEWRIGGPDAWGVSRETLMEGRWLTLLSHPIAHGSIGHLIMNCSALVTLTAVVRPLLGREPRGWGRYVVVLVGAAITSALVYLLLHPSDGLPIVGASGAICGLWGLAVRCDIETGHTRPLLSKIVLGGVRQFVISNIVLFGILFLLVRLEGGAGGLAWEAHLGGFLFGLLAAPWLIKPAESPMASARAATS